MFRMTQTITNPTRRTFLQGAAAGTLLTASGLPLRARAAEPKRGGELRVALVGGSSADRLDAHTAVTNPDLCRVTMLYDALVHVDHDANVSLGLAESVEPSKDAMQWTVRLKPGLKFHDGRPVRAEDVKYTYQRIANPEKPLAGASPLKQVDVDNIEILDDRTVRFPMKSAYAAFPDCTSAGVYFGIVPVDYDPAKPIGTGPFKFDSFTPGRESLFTRFDEYRGEGPNLDSVRILNFESDIAAFNALQGGQVDVFAGAPLSLAAQATPDRGLKTLVGKPGMWTPFTMRVDQAPFDNLDVRTAFRLLIDRQQMIDISLSGYGQVGNDVFGLYDPCRAPLVRERDVDQAKSLLKKAGHENLTVDLMTADIAAGTVAAAQVFARQAQDAGVTVNVKQIPVGEFYGEQYLQWTFAQDFWMYAPYLSQVARALLPDGVYNETHFNDEEFNRLYVEAQATVDPALHCEIIGKMQEIDFTRGGFIIPSFNQVIDLMSDKVEGFVPGAAGYPLGNYGFQRAWMA